jgi:hypothetical protein
MEEPRCRRHAEQGADLPAAARLAKNRDVVGVPAERSDVVPHPLEGRSEVERARIARIGVLLAGELGQVEEPEVAEPVIDGHDDHVAASGQPPPVVLRAAAGAGGPGPAVEPHEDRPVAAVGPGREDIQDQAVLALRLGFPACDAR